MISSRAEDRLCPAAEADFPSLSLRESDFPSLSLREVESPLLLDDSGLTFFSRLENGLDLAMLKRTAEGQIQR